MAGTDKVRRLPSILNVIFLTVYLNGMCASASADGPDATSRALFPVRTYPGPVKNYTGTRISDDSVRNAYYFEQTIAVVETGPEKEIINCELLEVKTEKDRNAALSQLEEFTMSKYEIDLRGMNSLMVYCQQLDGPNETETEADAAPVAGANIANPKELLSIFKGVFPGTKWCGSGDIAKTYYDLGKPATLDKCCRTHDFCPLKVASFKKEYGLTNISPYTRSHCECELMFYHCLKSRGEDLADLIGYLYFNIGKPICIEDVLSPDGYQLTERRFVRLGKRY